MIAAKLAETKINPQSGEVSMSTENNSPVREASRLRPPQVRQTQPSGCKVNSVSAREFQARDHYPPGSYR